MQITNFIDGSWVKAQAGEQMEVRNPATGELLGLTPLCGNADVGSAVEAGRRAFPDWRATPPVERARILFRLKALLEQHADELSASITREHGKNIAESRGERSAASRTSSTPAAYRLSCRANRWRMLAAASTV
jgi:acyl-CoA reductase-like NAD-dependent aldehyde dehydrogenase